MPSVSQSIEKFESRVENIEENFDDFPLFADYQSLIEGNGFQEELTKWSKVLSKETRRFSKMKVELSVVNRIRRKELKDIPASRLGDLKERVSVLVDKYEKFISVSRNRINSAKKLIESTRSLQSHAFS